MGGLAMIDERVHTLLIYRRRSSDSLRPVEDYVFHSGDVFTKKLAPPPPSGLRPPLAAFQTCP